MMMKRLFRSVRGVGLVTMFLVAVLLVSCNNDKKGSNINKITYDSVVVRQHVPLLEVNDTTMPYSDLQVVFTYPTKFGDAEQLKRLQQIFTGTFFNDRSYDEMLPKDAVDEYVNKYTSNYQELSNDFYKSMELMEDKDQMPMWFWYERYLSNTVLFENDSLVSYMVESSTYEGGAHGSYSRVYTNIDLNELVVLTEEDLFVPNYFKPLRDKIIDALMKENSVTEPDSLLNKGFFTLEDIVPNNNFQLNDEGIHYVYNQYEIAPYSMGVIEVLIPYSELEDILIPDGFINKVFLKK